MKIIVDTSKCIGAGLCCSSAAPTLFSQNDEEGVVVLLQENPPPNLHEAARAAVRLCPARAISIEE
jgi:ferredoxin